jgi:hypothetical protein
MIGIIRFMMGFLVLKRNDVILLVLLERSKNQLV